MDYTHECIFLSMKLFSIKNRIFSIFQKYKFNLVDQNILILMNSILYSLMIMVITNF
jgi:hypothetical protein